MGLTYEQSLEHFLKTFQKSKEMSDEAAKYIPGSYSRRSFNYGPHAIYVNNAKGAYVYTVDGKKLLDFNNNFTVSVLGYQNEAVDQALIQTMKKGFSIGNPTEEEGELARMLCERIDSFEKVKFFCSASEACVGALRIARGYTGKTKVAKMEGGYHGFLDDFSFSAHPNASKADDDLEHIVPQPESAGIPANRAEDVVLLTQNNIEVSEKLIREHADELACVVMELQSGSGGIVTLDKAFVKRIREITKELGIVLIFDETITIRAYKGGLQSWYGVKPDLTISGKTLGGGIPLGVVGGSNEVMDVVTKDIVQMSGTHLGHRLACAAGIAILKQLDDVAYKRLTWSAQCCSDGGWCDCSNQLSAFSRSFFADSSIHACLFRSLLLRLLSFDFSLCIFLAQAGQYFDMPERGTYSTPHTVQFLGFNAVHRFVGVICNSPTKPMNL